MPSAPSDVKYPIPNAEDNKYAIPIKKYGKQAHPIFIFAVLSPGNFAANLTTFLVYNLQA